MATEDDVVGTYRCECGWVLVVEEGQAAEEVSAELERHLEGHATSAS